MTPPKSRLEILQLIEDGQISADEGLRLLNEFVDEAASASADPAASQAATGPTAPGPQTQAASTNRTAPEQDPDVQYWRRWWMIPMFVGIGVIVLASLMMYWAVQSSGVGFWFLCAWVPMLLGLGITALAWASRKARWVHVRVDTGENQRPRRIAISLPIPLGIVAWAVRTFGWRIPAMRRTAIDDLLVALDDTHTPEAPIYIDVNESGKGERVQVYIG